mmetsp:Transcript_16031/g.23590  ORF Transcript_16031/g.23590 Transcript_16031/m.23590 type:complete len:443 (-) Transcript_16031:42-1370(-)|eukprot:CAMPEP_0194228452 /NCGR_PEP_ID=MMETSP0156-20130528/43375_1 /TAXON_ID=33649 /ORGANISM="Thalassionema nitzschioides, Strain L26-B" /LENGTH=442 /DNA_ID=CAMNT_0038960965 /DNA_START=321 /DNA_END=1649 /DNA_ORIENTATION=-
MSSAFHLPISRDEQMEVLHVRGNAALNQGSSNHKFIPNEEKLAEEYDFDETEDEEVKLNCAGRLNVYMTTSEEEDSEEDDDEESTNAEEPEEYIDEIEVPAFITCEVQRNIKIHRPRPIFGMVAGGDSDCDSYAIDDVRRPLHLYDYPDHARGDDSADADDERSTAHVQIFADKNEVIAESESGDYQGETGIVTESNSNKITEAKRDDSSESLRSSCQDSNVGRNDNGSVNGDQAPVIASINYSSRLDDEINTQEGHPELKETLLLGNSKRYLSSIFTDEDTTNRRDLTDRKDATKRTKCNKTPLQDLFLGSSLYDHVIKLRDATVSPFSVYDSDNDKQLSEELLESDFIRNRESTPVPLLSPPPSPLCVESDRGQLTTVCEWPSNLAVDNALTMVASLRAHSPTSLLKIEEDEEDRIMSFYQSIEPGTTLTPLMNGISVGL